MIRAEGNPRVAMYSLLIGALLNTLLNPLFLFVLGWGMRGAATATVLSQAVSAMWVAELLRARQEPAQVPHATSAAALEYAAAPSIAYGSPMFAMQMAGSVMNTMLFNQLRVHGGDLADLGHGDRACRRDVRRHAHLRVEPGRSTDHRLQLRCGKYDRVLRTLQLSICCATIDLRRRISGGHVGARLRGRALFHRHDQRDPQLMEVGTHAIRICLAMFPIVGFQIVSSSYFQAVGKPKHALLLGLSRQVLLLIPAIIILPHFLGLDGVWLRDPDRRPVLVGAHRHLVVLRAAPLAGSARRRCRAGRIGCPPDGSGLITAAARSSTSRDGSCRCAGSS